MTANSTLGFVRPAPHRQKACAVRLSKLGTAHARRKLAELLDQLAAGMPAQPVELRTRGNLGERPFEPAEEMELAVIGADVAEDRKSTRLNSSHLGISYAVFCLKKKKQTRSRQARSDSRAKAAAKRTS